MQAITPCLMFVGDQHGRAEEAIELYVSLFENARILELERYAAGEEEPEGTVKRARFELAGREFIAMDSAQAHHFTFTPATSFFVDCDAEDEVDRLFAALAEGGAVLMELGEYPFSPRFGWLNDRFGVSWQLFVAAAEAE